MEVFSSYLSSIRTDAGLTQQKLLDRLIDYDTAFERLDLNTLSRWERGVTTPPITKQILIVRCLGLSVDDLPSNLLPNENENENEKLEYSLLRTVDPYSTSQNDVVLKKIEDVNEFRKIEVQINQFHKDYLSLDINSSKLYEQNNATFVSISDIYHKSLLGHFLYGFLPETALKENIKVKHIENIKFHSISEVENTKSILYVVSAYSSRSEPRVKTLESIIKMIAKHKNIKGFCITIQYQEVLDFFNDITKFTIISIGKKIKFGGVKVYKNNAKYVQIYIKSEELLSSEFILKISKGSLKMKN